MKIKKIINICRNIRYISITFIIALIAVFFIYVMFKAMFVA